MKDIVLVKQAIAAQSARFAMVANPGANPIPIEVSVDEIIKEIKARLKLGMALHPPAASQAAGKFSGMQIIVTDPVQPGMQVQPKTHLLVHVYTDLDDMAAQADQNFLCFSIIGIVFTSFLEDSAAEAEKANQAFALSAAEGKLAKPAGGTLEEFPGTPAAPAK